MKTRVFAAACFVAFPLATVLTVAQTTADLQVRTTQYQHARAGRCRCRRSAGLQACRLRVRPAARRARQDRRRVHRLLSVRLRRLDREEPGAVGPRELGTLRGAPGAQQRDAPQDSRDRSRGPRSRLEEDRRLLRVVPRRDRHRREGRQAAGSAAEEDRRAVERRRPARRSSPNCTRSASTCSSSSARRPTSRMRRWKWRSPIRAGSACPIATTT